jgi:hypothetical protein
MTVTESRPLIVPRLIIVHTNGASNEGNQASAYSWSMRAPNNTKPHYQVDRDGTASKFLPSNRKGIGNGTVASRTGGVMAADFSLVIETADLGWGAGKPGPTCGFSEAQAETLAQIIAWESSLWDIPVAYPVTWDGAGVACHTEPFGYPYWTIDPGHVCPGLQKKIEVAQVVMPRANQILKSTTTVTVEDNMQIVSPNTRVYDSRDDTQLEGMQTRTIYLGPAAEAAQAAQVNLTVVALNRAGYVVAFGEADVPPTSNVNFLAGQVQANAAIVKVTGGRINLWSNVPCHVIVDLQALWP